MVLPTVYVHRSRLWLDDRTSVNCIESSTRRSALIEAAMDVAPFGRLCWASMRSLVGRRRPHSHNPPPPFFPIPSSHASKLPLVVEETPSDGPHSDWPGRNSPPISDRLPLFPRERSLIMVVTFYGKVSKYVLLRCLSNQSSEKRIRLEWNDFQPCIMELVGRVFINR